MTITDVIFLGAGASKSEGAPLQNELLINSLVILEKVMEVKKTIKSYDNWAIKSKDILPTVSFSYDPVITRDNFLNEYSSLFSLEPYFREVWGINLATIKEQKSKIHFPTFEECLGVIDNAQLRLESLKLVKEDQNTLHINEPNIIDPKLNQYHFSNITRQYIEQYIGERGEEQVPYYLSPPNVYNLDNVRNALIHLIATTIDICVKKEIGDKVHYHSILVKRLISEDLIKNTAFITTNYDCLSDIGLIGSNEVYPDYGIEFSFHEETINKIKERRKEIEQIHCKYWLKRWIDKLPAIAVPLLKVHGSFNWLYCPTCNRITPYVYQYDNKEYSRLSLYTVRNACRSCGVKNLQPVIVPPTFYKQMDNLYLRLILNKVDFIFRGAKRIFFCGYSFPDADMHIKYLLKKAELLNGRTPEIYIINYHSEKQDHRIKLEKQRYERFFNNDDNVFYVPISFQEFCENGLPDPEIRR